MKITTATKSLNGTSFHDGYVKATYNQLLNVFGKHHYDDIDKISAQWGLQTNDGLVFAIYDWNEYGNYPIHNKDVEYDWHIGTKTVTETHEVIKALKSIGLNAIHKEFSI